MQPLPTMALPNFRAALAATLASLAFVAVAHAADQPRGEPKPVRTYEDLARETGLTSPGALALGRMAVDVAGKEWPKTVSFRCYAKGGHVESGLKPPPATRVFDNVYYLGDADVSSWAIDTPDGFILVDALSSEADAQHYIVDGMRSLGLDPTRIRYIILTHEHFDHYGGAMLLKRLSGARIAASQQAWSAMATLPVSATAPVPPKDIVLEDGERLSLGGMTVTSVHTPGHTPGTVSVILPARWQGSIHNAAIWGGNGFPTGFEDRKIFLRSVDHFAEFTNKAKVDIELAIHGDTDDLIARLATLRRANGPNPFLVGREAYLRYEETYRLCSRARMEERGDWKE